MKYEKSQFKLNSFCCNLLFGHEIPLDSQTNLLLLFSRSDFSHSRFAIKSFRRKNNNRKTEKQTRWIFDGEKDVVVPTNDFHLGKTFLCFSFINFSIFFFAQQKLCFERIQTDQWKVMWQKLIRKSTNSICSSYCFVCDFPNSIFVFSHRKIVIGKHTIEKKSIECIHSVKTQDNRRKIEKLERKTLIDWMKTQSQVHSQSNTRIREKTKKTFAETKNHFVKNVARCDALQED